MKFGFSMPTRGPLARPASIKALATKAEELGYDFIVVSDHVVVPKNIDSIYPYNETGAFAGSDTGEALEQLTTMSYIAACTSDIRIMSSVMVVPHRPAVLAAKVLSTIDVLSEGRLIVGIGVGWMREEFEAIGAPDFDRRGQVTDEYIEAFKELWSNNDSSYDGEFVSFSNISFAPKPLQQPGPPICVGGESPPALRRAATLGDIWYPFCSNPRFPVGTPDQYAQYADRVKRHAENAGRDPSEIGYAYAVNWYNDREEVADPDGNRRPLTGTPEQIAEDVAAYEKVGVGHMMLNLQGPTMDETVDLIERFAKDVRLLTSS